MRRPRAARARSGIRPAAGEWWANAAASESAHRCRAAQALQLALYNTTLRDDELSAPQLHRCRARPLFGMLPHAPRLPAALGAGDGPRLTTIKGSYAIDFGDIERGEASGALPSSADEVTSTFQLQGHEALQGLPVRFPAKWTARYMAMPAQMKPDEKTCKAMVSLFRKGLAKVPVPPARVPGAGSASLTFEHRTFEIASSIELCASPLPGASLPAQVWCHGGCRLQVCPEPSPCGCERVFASGPASASA